MNPPKADDTSPDEATPVRPGRAHVARPGRPGQQSETDGFDEFYRTNVQSLTQQMYAYLGDLEEARDVVQEAFCRALTRWNKLVDYDDPVAWVRRVSWNLATSHWRRLGTRAAFLRRQRSEDVAGPGPDRVALVHALSALPTPQRRVFVLHYLADMPVAEIARMENVPDGTVRSWLHRARAALAPRLTDERKGGRDV